MRFDKIDAVLKITERCNINCTYCYMFNKESKLYESKPKQMSHETMAAVAKFLADSAIAVDASVVHVIFHGGEPTMMNLANFEAHCKTLLDVVGAKAKLIFSLQTNAMLISESWIRLLEKYRIVVGVSLDGNRETNDLHRIDHTGRGTYDRSMKGVKLLIDAHRAGRISPVGVLCVIDPAKDGGSTFRHFAEEIGFQWLDFLLPIDTRDTISLDAGLGVGRYLSEVYNAWNELGDKRVSIRFFDQFYNFMTGIDRTTGVANKQSAGTLILTFASDGTYGPDDTLRIVSDDYFKFDCRKTKLTDYLQHALIENVQKANMTLPSGCKDCAWAAYCVGGATNGRLVNRYSALQEYDEKSILCDGLTHIYSVLALGLLEIGYPRQTMFERLDCAVGRLQ